ncbi:MAG: sugar transferase [Rhodobacter sp.]|nr:sugar transferase [Rhodobacter sp.]
MFEVNESPIAYGAAGASESSDVRAGFSDGSRRDVSPRLSSNYCRFGKRTLDVLLVLMSAPVALVLMLAFAIAVGFSGGKPFYSQDRVGKGGRTFRMWKIRSMVADADAVLKDYLGRNPDKAEEWTHKQKLDQDPRVTALGRFIRRTSIDEVPQLWNVLRGDMSLVGPRPMMVNQRDLYPGSAYFHLRPGLTGLWQISGRNDVSFKSRAQFDSDYGSSLSLREDIRIILETVRVVCRATGK